ncbi:MAG: sulfatase [Bacteroidales bacterium]|nr:sulfatase [Bacteroidales bacterium]
MMLAAGIAGPGMRARSADRPNVVFFMAEDLARESFALYNGYAARAPFLEGLAREGVTFTNAYSCAPVSSAARSSLITGCYAPSSGISCHRKFTPVTLPEGVRLFPYYLRQAGYHTSNVRKTDYNCRMDPQAWDIPMGKIGDWRNRPSPETPFFECITDEFCHEHSLFFKEGDVGAVSTRHNPDSVHLYPMHPDTPLMRYTYARHYDCIEEVDRHFGKVLDMLREDGLMEDTFVFYMGDNGGCLPGTKAYMSEAGLNVPLVVYVPEKWKDLSPYPRGAECPAAVSFLDLAPTLLALAGAEIPSHLVGKPFMGEGVTREMVESMDEIICFRDRIGGHSSPARTLRKGSFKYVRYFHPHEPKLLGGYYRLYQAAFREWYRLHGEGSLNPVQDAWFRPQGAEELFDLESDPWESRNLAGERAYRQKLEEMRSILDGRMLEMHDMGVIPETVWLPYSTEFEAFKQQKASSLADYLAIVSLQREPFRRARRHLRQALASPDEVIRYWAAVNCCHFGRKASRLKRYLAPLLEDGSPMVRSMAATWFALVKGLDPSAFFDGALSGARNEAEILSILNDAACVKALHPEIPLTLKYGGIDNIDVRDRLESLVNWPYDPGKSSLKYHGWK